MSKPPGRVHPATQVLRDAARVVDNLDTTLDAEWWISRWLGAAWATSPQAKRDPELALAADIVKRARNTPSAAGAVTVAALRRLLPPDTVPEVAGPPPSWADAPGSTPTEAWRAVNVWGSERALLIEFDGPSPHSLIAFIAPMGPRVVHRLGVLKAGAAEQWDQTRPADAPPMPLTDAPVDEVLAELADALQATDQLWPRQVDESVGALRMLAWSRCRGYAREPVEPEPLSDEESARLIDEFAVDDTDRALARRFIEFGEIWLNAGPLCWSQEAVQFFVRAWIPAIGGLPAAELAAWPGALRRWIGFALRSRGLAEEWIEPVVNEVPADG